MLPATSAAARDPTFAQEWQRLAQQMGAALAFKHHDIREEARRQQKIAMEQQLEATCAKLPPYWSPVSPELPHEFAGQVVIYDAGRGASLLVILTTAYEAFLGLSNAGCMLLDNRITCSYMHG